MDGSQAKALCVAHRATFCNLERSRLVAYGCCEKLTQFIPLLQKVPILRRIVKAISIVQGKPERLRDWVTIVRSIAEEF